MQLSRGYRRLAMHPWDNESQRLGREQRGLGSLCGATIIEYFCVVQWLWLILLQCRL